MVDVVGVLQGNLHQVDDEHNADEGGGLDQMVEPVSASKGVSREMGWHLSKGR